MFLKAEKWWVFKIAGGMLTALLVTVSFNLDVDTVCWINLAKLFGAFLLLAVFGHLINDLSDLGQDLAAGKSNVVTTFGKNVSVLLAILSALCALVLVLSIGSVWIAILVVVQILLNSIYSLRPIRLKERGVWALLITGFYERALPYSMIAVLLLMNKEAVDYNFLLPYLLWAYVWEVRNHLNGQLLDRGSDQKSGVKSIASLNEIGTVRNWMLRLLLVEMALLFSWFICFEYSIAIVTLSLLLSWYFHKRKNGFWQVGKKHVYSMVDDVYNFNFPVLFALAFSAYCNQSLWPVFVVLLIGFDNHLRKLFLVVLDKLRWKIVGSDLMWLVKERLGKN